MSPVPWASASDSSRGSSTREASGHSGWAGCGVSTQMICVTGLSASEPRTSPLAPRHAGDSTPRSRERQGGSEHPQGSAPNPLPCSWPTRAPMQPDDLGPRQPRWAIEPSGLLRMPLVSARRLRSSNKRCARRCGASGMDAAWSGRSVPRPETADPWSRRFARSPPERAFVVPRRDVPACRGTGSTGAQLGMAEPGGCTRLLRQSLHQITEADSCIR